MPANPFPFDSTQTVASSLAQSTRPQAVDSCLHSGDWLSVTSSRFSLSSELLKFLGLFAVLNCWHCFTCSASASPTSTRLLPDPAHVRLGHPSGGGLCSCCWRWLLSISLDDGGRTDEWTTVSGFASRCLSARWQWNWFNAFLCPLQPQVESSQQERQRERRRYSLNWPHFGGVYSCVLLVHFLLTRNILIIARQSDINNGIGEGRQAGSRQQKKGEMISP